MDIDALRDLSKGDIVKSAVTGETYVVTGNYGDRVTAVKTVDIINPGEWVLVVKASGNLRSAPHDSANGQEKRISAQERKGKALRKRLD